jgi:hypothetical protein
MAEATDRQLKDRLLVACERVVVYSWFPDQPAYLERAKAWAGKAFAAAEQLSPHLNGALTVGRLVAQLERTLSDRSMDARLHTAMTYAQQDVSEGESGAR